MIDKSLFYKHKMIISLAIYAMPTILVLTGIVGYDYRYSLFAIMAALIIAIELIKPSSWRDYGFRADNIKESLVINGFLSLSFVLIALIGYLSGLLGQRYDIGLGFFFLYVVISAPIQEFIFRSVVFLNFDRLGIKNNYRRVILSSLIFVLPHLLYASLKITIVVFLIGLVWGYIYDKHRNWYGVALSHSIMGIVAIFLGLV